VGEAARHNRRARIEELLCSWDVGRVGQCPARSACEGDTSIQLTQPNDVGRPA
jgi:hypothetical protein